MKRKGKRKEENDSEEEGNEEEENRKGKMKEVITLEERKIRKYKEKIESLE